MKFRFGFLAAAAVVALTSCAWSGPLGDAGGTNFNPLGGLDASTVSNLTDLWHPSDPAATVVSLDARFAYAIAPDSATARPRLSAYAADGSAPCAGTPRTCEPVWSAVLTTDAFKPLQPNFPGSAVLVGPYVVVTFRSGPNWRLSLFDRNGIDGCSAAVPRVCAPVGSRDLFPASSGQGPPTVTEGSGSVFAVGWLNTPIPPAPFVSPIAGFHVADLVGCTAAAACMPFFQATTDALTPHPAYANGRLYVRAASGAVVFDAAAIQACVAGVCAPLWT